MLKIYIKSYQKTLNARMLCHVFWSQVEYKIICFIIIGEIPESSHFDYFKLEDGELYYRGNRKPLTTKGSLNWLE